MKVIINIDVPELAPAIEFYCAALGVKHARTLDQDVAELIGASSTMYLLKKARGTQAVHQPAIARDYQRHWTPVHFDFVVPDVDVAAKRALAAGARQESDRVDWCGSRCISLSDPFGHGFCFVEFETNETYD